MTTRHHSNYQRPGHGRLSLDSNESDLQSILQYNITITELLHYSTFWSIRSSSLTFNLFHCYMTTFWHVIRDVLCAEPYATCIDHHRSQAAWNHHRCLMSVSTTIKDTPIAPLLMVPFSLCTQNHLLTHDMLSFGHVISHFCSCPYKMLQPPFFSLWAIHSSYSLSFSW